MSDKIKDIFEKNNIVITDQQCKLLKEYYNLLIEWNEKVNLTAITEYEEVIRKHFLDSVLPVKNNFQTTESEIKILDLGTGAGFPGIVLAIFCPQIHFTLVDSLNKRIDFLKIVIDKLKLDNVDLIHERAEDLGQNKKYRNQFDYVVSRAVAELPILMEYCIPFVKVNGFFISYKGIKYEEEIELTQNAFKQLHSELIEVQHYVLDGQEDRYLLFIRNNTLTDAKYPRKAGKPKKKPL